MEVTDLQGYSGMAFVYDEDVQNAFHMRNTPTPLSIAWIAADGSVVSTADMEPCEDRDGCPTYPPVGPLPIRHRGVPGRPGGARHHRVVDRPGRRQLRAHHLIAQAIRRSGRASSSLEVRSTCNRRRRG